MPRCIMLGPCRKAITDKSDNSLSVIQILTGLSIEVSMDEDIDGGYYAPADWTVFAIWNLLPGDEDKLFEQRIEIFLPDGKSWATVDAEFVIFPNEYHIQTANFDMFPVSQQGNVTVRLYYRERDKQGDWEFAADYPLSVKVAVNKLETKLLF